MHDYFKTDELTGLVLFIGFFIVIAIKEKKGPIFGFVNTMAGIIICACMVNMIRLAILRNVALGISLWFPDKFFALLFIGVLLLLLSVRIIWLGMQPLPTNLEVNESSDSVEPTNKKNKITRSEIIEFTIVCCIFKLRTSTWVDGVIDVVAVSWLCNELINSMILKKTVNSSQHIQNQSISKKIWQYLVKLKNTSPLTSAILVGVTLIEVGSGGWLSYKIAPLSHGWLGTATFIVALIQVFYYRRRQNYCEETVN